MTEKEKARQGISQSGPLVARGSLDDDAIVRAILAQVMKDSPKSREQIAEEMSHFLGHKVTAGMLNNRSASSRETHVFPLSWVRAFCTATNDWRLLRTIAERSELRVIGQEEVDLLELGRQYLRRRQADAEISKIEDKFGGKR